MKTAAPAAPVRVPPQFDTPAQQDAAATLGLWVFLATELMFFGPLFFGYSYGRSHFPQAFAVASRHTDVVLGSVNTAVLLTSSFTMALAAGMRKADGRRAAMWLLWATAALGIAFLFIKGTEYLHDWQQHLIPGTGFALGQGDSAGAQLFFFLYFATTALHAVHLTLGISVTGVFAFALRRGAVQFANGERIELVALYWHFVDVIWIFLYPILYLVGRSGG
jgi:cytochrome c oxidase subunit 3